MGLLECDPLVRSRNAAVAVAAFAVALPASFAAASPVPYLRSVGVQHRHVIAVIALDDLAPDHIAVAAGPKTGADGAFVRANVLFTETLRVTRIASGYRATTRHRLRPGRYYAQVSGLIVGLDCAPARPCREQWSNVRRVVVPRAR